MDPPRKKLGQHWLTDEATLEAICDSADLDKEDTVLEIGPGHGNLTQHLVERVKKVVAVEKDEKLAGSLQGLTLQQGLTLHGELEVVSGDILKFDLTELPPGYKVVANIPYYLTSNLLRTLSESSNPPASITLLVQREVAERICANPGQMSFLSVSVQLYYECALGRMVPARLFTPRPKVDSQVVHLQRRAAPLFTGYDPVKYMMIVKAGFSERRKKLRSSLSGGLNIPKQEADNLLKRAGIDGGLRAQALSLDDWHKLYRGL